MLVRVKEPPTSIEILGPDPDAILRVLRSHFEVQEDDDNELVPVEDVPWYQEALSRRTPGSTLRIRRDNAGLTLQALSDKTGIPKGHLSSMERGKRPIGPIIAKKLASALGCDYRSLL
jgi:Helix-turn-helix